ncbi:hypothetical protein PF003_g32855 [Phytophthora fragariae]|nr:hypothetical protein PF003_g32855 [Phytophthora fragariae]
MDTTLVIKNSNYFDNKFQPGEGEVHVLVKVPASPPTKQRKTLWQEQTTLNPKASTLSLDGRGHVWSLAPADISGFGLGQSSSAKLFLFCRDAAADLIAFLLDDVVRDGHTGFVVGPPGSGKSSTAAVFALALPRTSAWVVTWIHLIRDEPPICVRLEGNEKKTFKLLTPDLDDLVAILFEVEDTKHHVVFLDGVTQNDTELKVCTGWVRQKWDTRRLVLVTSMSSRRKVKLDDDAGKKAMQHNVPSWNLDEYLKAVEDDELFQSVLPYLDASDDEEVPTDAASMRTWRELILLSKFYFAGGNARYMFGYPTATVMEALDDAVKAAVDNPPAAIGLVWEQSASVIARLYGSFGGNLGLISRYAATGLAVAGGAELVKRFASILRKDSNAAVDGWIVDMYFFARIRKGGLVVYEGENVVEFPQSIVVVVDPTNLPVLPTKCWLKPKRYNQGGYDAVYIDKDEGLERFVQVAKNDRESFLIHHFKVLLDSLEKTALAAVNKLEIFCAIEKQKMPNFAYSTVMGQGHLEKFGWAENEESSKVSRVAIKGVEIWDVLGW